jgi:hypothetical protein
MRILAADGPSRMCRARLSARTRTALVLALLAFAAGCAGSTTGEGPDSAVAFDSLGIVVDTTGAIDSAGPAATPGLPVVTGESASAGRHAALPPLADSIAQRLVFAPVLQRAFVAAVRGQRLLMDIGRVDTEVRKDSARARAYRDAVAARSPFPQGMRVRLHGPWGSEDAEITGFDTWNGRIVATLGVSPLVDSLAATTEPLTALAERSAEARPAATRACDAQEVAAGMRARAKAVGDSLLRVLESADSASAPGVPAPHPHDVDPGMLR